MTLLRLALFLSLLSGMVHAYVAEPDVIYDVVDANKLGLDVYRPTIPSQDPRPALIFVHGGCFNSGSRKDIPEDMKILADEGFTVFSIGYRLSTVAKYPAAVSDLQQGIRFIRKNAEKFQIDPDKIVVHGESAGGYLAALMGVRPMPTRSGIIDELSSRVQLVSEWYGRTDFTATQTTGTDCAVSFLGLERTPETLDHFKKASVMSDVDKDSAPFFIIHGTNDQQVYPIHSTLLANTLWENGIKADLYFNENEGHAFGRETPWLVTKAYLFNFFKMPAQATKIVLPTYQAKFQILERFPISGKFDLDLFFGQGPAVSILHQQDRDSFDSQTNLIKGKVGIISKTKVFSLKLNSFSRRYERIGLGLDWSYKKL